MSFEIWSGGQTGVDRAAWDMALAKGMRQDGWVPKGRRALDGMIPLRYQCRQSHSPSYPDRTRKNIEDTDATLILGFGEPAGGTLLTLQLCEKMGKPYLFIDLENEFRGEEQVHKFLELENPHRLNIAGPRENEDETVSERAEEFLSKVF